MTRKRTKVRIRRAACLLVMLIGALSAWNAGALILWNAVHGWRQLPQMLTALFTAWGAAELTGILSR